jgi:hypothetical protein
VDWGRFVGPLSAHTHMHTEPSSSLWSQQSQVTIPGGDHTQTTQSLLSPLPWGN